jgi:hypothetical protein
MPATGLDCRSASRRTDDVFSSPQPLDEQAHAPTEEKNCSDDRQKCCDAHTLRHRRPFGFKIAVRRP